MPENFFPRGECLTQQQVACIFDISVVRVQQLERRALRKLWRNPDMRRLFAEVTGRESDEVPESGGLK